MKSTEASGRTIHEAVTAAVAQLETTTDKVRVEVLSEGDDGGSFGGPTARVRVTELSELALRIRDQITQLVTLMDVEAKVYVSDEAEDTEEGSRIVNIEVLGDDVGILIGWRGEHLRALQAVANLLANSRGEKARVLVDVGGYRSRREETVRGIALRAARQARMTGDKITLDPMPAFERRAIHLALESDPSVTTESVGEEPSRRVQILPVRGAVAAAEPDAGWSR
jgi:spoIIIJ-associated protein